MHYLKPTTGAVGNTIKDVKREIMEKYNLSTRQFTAWRKIPENRRILQQRIMQYNTAAMSGSKKVTFTRITPPSTRGKQKKYD